MRLIALVVMTDGRRDCIEASISSLEEQGHEFGTRIIHDDSADPAYRSWLNERYGNRYRIISTHRRSGFAGAVRSAWAHIRPLREPFVFVTEDDFTFSERLDFYGMTYVLMARPDIVQVALKRQPWNATEAAAGGIVEANPDDFAEVSVDGEVVTVHRRFFTTNPYLARRSLMVRHEWPAGEQSEGRFTHELLSDHEPPANFAYWGRKFDPPKVHHIGHHRVGTGY